MQLPAHDYLFRTLKDKKVIPPKLFWIAVFIAFVVANAPPAKISNLLFNLLQLVSENVITSLNAQNKDLHHISSTMISMVFIPIKKLLFFLSLLVLASPIVICVYRYKSFWSNPGLKGRAISALGFFPALSVLSFPYSYPWGLNSHPSGLAGLGIQYGYISMAPFRGNNPIYYKRLLKPALAHYLQMDGYVLYYLFSLICTYLVIFLTVTFLESKLLVENSSGESPLKWLSVKNKWFLYLSLMTSSFILVDFQWPGYSDNLSFILVLLMAIIPMTPQARLASVALCVVNHEGIALALVPVILFCFPKGERITAITVVALFYAMVVAGYGFSATKGLQGQGTMGDKGTVWETALHGPGLFLTGLFFSYKLLWIPFAYAVWMLWNQKEKTIVLAIIMITLFPVLLTFFAWDTTRVSGFGFLGMLTALGLLIQQHGRSAYHYTFVTLIYANLLIPSYNVLISYQNSFSSYPYPGLYMLIDSVARRLLT